MKKLFSLLVASAMVLSLTACGNTEEANKEVDFGGTWKVDSIEYEGSKFTVDEWKNMDEEDYSDFYIIFKDGGKAYVYEDGYGDLVDWLESGDTIMIDDEKCTVVDDTICYEYYGENLLFKKTSDSQEIPKEDEGDDDDSTEEDTTEEEDASEEDVESSEIFSDEVDHPTESNDTEENESADESTEETSDGDEEWRQFLKDYEAWVDNYVEIVKKYNENPADLSILADYTKLVSEMSDWTERADEIEAELEDTSAATEYAAELLRIAGKLAEAAN